MFELDSVNSNEVKSLLENLQPENYLSNAQSGYEVYVNQSHLLYQKLVQKPLESFESINKLFIIPDKSLNYLPFDLLIGSMPNSMHADYKKLTYLIKDYAISYGYSASILFRDNEERSEEEREHKLLAIAPSYQPILKDTALLATLGKFRNGFEELAYNTSEIEKIENYFDGKTLKAETATEGSFWENYKNYDILHFAMHALVDNEESERSKLVFTPGQDTLYDNYLHNFELYNADMKAKMVVLSACNTGDGELASGEGVKSMAQAFTYAGAESVVMSHWRVDDKASSIMMDYFYKYLAKGEPKDNALRLAKLEFLENASPSQAHPFSWGAFAVVGDVSPLNAPTKWYMHWWIYLTVVSVLLSGVLVFRKSLRAGNPSLRAG